MSLCRWLGNNEMSNRVFEYTYTNIAQKQKEIIYNIKIKTIRVQQPRPQYNSTIMNLPTIYLYRYKFYTVFAP
jgi:hypothetical protein